jgi:hypothetical protein
MKFAGYAAVFDVVDAGGDVVRRGAFGSPATPALLWQHDATRPIGRVLRLAEDGRGLRVVAELSEGASGGRDAAALLRTRAIDGLSIGYRVKKTRPRSGGGRELLALELVEVSLVTFPMQRLARVLGVEEETGA